MIFTINAQTKKETLLLSGNISFGIYVILSYFLCKECDDMNRIFITVNGIEHELRPNDFNEVLKILRKNKNYDCFINIENNYIGLIRPDSNAVCSYICVFMD